MTTNSRPHKGAKPTAKKEAEGSSADGADAKARKAASAFRTISEVADDLGVQQHVLRFWETKFTQVKPLKRGGGRRYYRPEDVVLLKKIHHLLYTEGYTIKGVQKLMKGQGKQQIVAGEIAQEVAGRPANHQGVKTDTPVAGNRNGKPLSERQRAILESMLGELKDLRTMIKGE
jgi:DNA-binding transcriptional MerR regulator